MSALRGPAGLTNTPAAPLAGTADTSLGVRPMPSGDHEQVFFHFDLLRSLQMHKLMAAGIFLLALLAAAAYLVRGWNSYTAQALVYVQPAPPRLLETTPENRWPYDSNTYESYIQQQIHNVTRPDVLVAAVKKIPGWQRSGENIQLSASRLGRALTVERVGSGYQISITAKAKSADKAAQVANASAASFIESATREMRAGDDQRIQLLQDERDRVQKELAADRAEQDDLNKKLGVAAIGNGPVDPIDQQIDAVRAELIKARADSDDAAARLMATKGGTASSAALDAAADDLVAADPGLVSMKTSLNARRSLLISQMSNLTPNNPQYKQDSEELTHINSSLDSMTKELRAKAAEHIQQKLKSDLERTSTVEARLNAQLAQLTAAAGTAGPRLQRLNELSADIQRLQSRFALVDAQYRNMMLENHAPGSVFLSAAAVPPLGASRDQVLRNAVVMVLAGLFLGWGAALLAHNLDQRVYIAKDVERVLGFSPMAQIPDFGEVSAGVEEEYLLRLAAALEHAYQQGELKSCIFTGVTTGTGATTICTRVTNMLEAMGRSTVLVDASGVPTSAPQAESAPAETEAGLVHAPRGSRPTALLQQMAEEKGEDTIVLSDTAPLLVSGETEYLARFVDSAIVVIESGVTTKSQLRDVAHTLQRLDVSAVGFVLNRISKEKANPSFREAVRAVEQRFHGSVQASAKTKKEPKSARPKQKKAAETEESEPRKSKKKKEDAPASAEAARVTMEEVFQEAPAAPIQVPRSEAASVASPSVIPEKTPAEQVSQAPALDAQQAQEEPAAPAPLRGRSLRQTAPPTVPLSAVPVAAAPIAPSAPQFAGEVRAPEPAIQVSTPPEPPTAPEPAQAIHRPMVAKEPAAEEPVSSSPQFAGANPAALREVALQTRASAPEGELREVPYSAARLGGLRNLLVSLGLRSLNKDGEFSENETAPEPVRERAAERPTERPVYAEPLAPIAKAADVQEPAQAPIEVVAKPEFLPPNPLVEVTEKEPEKETRPAAPAPRKGRADNDDIDILPSWRGQYRKRR